MRVPSAAAAVPRRRSGAAAAAGGAACGAGAAGGPAGGGAGRIGDSGLAAVSCTAVKGLRRTGRCAAAASPAISGGGDAAAAGCTVRAGTPPSSVHRRAAAKNTPSRAAASAARCRTDRPLQRLYSISVMISSTQQKRAAAHAVSCGAAAPIVPSFDPLHRAVFPVPQQHSFRTLSLQRLQLRAHDALVRLDPRLIECIHIRKLPLIGYGHGEQIEQLTEMICIQLRQGKDGAVPSV